MPPDDPPVVVVPPDEPIDDPLSRYAEVTEGGTPPGATVPPPDLNINIPPEEEADPMVTAFTSAYFELWGIVPPPGYVERFIKDGYNIFEFIDNEKAKPAFRQASSYRDQYAGFAGQLARLFGTRR